MPLPPDPKSPAHQAVVRAKRLAEEELSMFNRNSGNKELRHVQAKTLRSNRLLEAKMLRQANGLAAQARQNRVIASRERNNAVKNQIMAEDLNFQVERANRIRAEAEANAKREAAQYHRRLESEFETIGVLSPEEAAHEEEMRAERDRLAQKQRDRAAALGRPWGGAPQRLPAILTSPRGNGLKSPRVGGGMNASSSPGRKPQWSFPSRHHPIQRPH